MKRSEMVEVILNFLYGNSNNPDHYNDSLALLNTIEKAGMLPPMDKSYEFYTQFAEWEQE